MAICEVCGNDYDKVIEVIMPNGENHFYDCFECAIHILAPVCEHCGVSLIGHAVEANGSIYCSAHCAQREDGGVKIDLAENQGEMKDVKHYYKKHHC